MVADLHPKSPRKAAANRAERAVESRRGRTEHETVAKKIAAPQEAATPSKKRKAAEDSEEESVAVSDVAKRATSTIYKKRKVVTEAKADAVVDTKSVEREARLSLGKKRKAADALEGDAVQAVPHGDAEPSAKKRTEVEPVVETEPFKEAVTARSKNVKTEEVFFPFNRSSWNGSHLPIGSVHSKTRNPSGKFVRPKGSNERGPKL